MKHSLKVYQYIQEQEKALGLQKVKKEQKIAIAKTRIFEYLDHNLDKNISAILNEKYKKSGVNGFNEKVDGAELYIKHRFSLPLALKKMLSADEKVKLMENTLDEWIVKTNKEYKQFMENTGRRPFLSKSPAYSINNNITIEEDKNRFNIGVKIHHSALSHKSSDFTWPKFGFGFSMGLATTLNFSDELLQIVHKKISLLHEQETLNSVPSVLDDLSRKAKGNFNPKPPKFL